MISSHGLDWVSRRVAMARVCLFGSLLVPAILLSRGAGAVPSDLEEIVYVTEDFGRCEAIAVVDVSSGMVERTTRAEPTSPGRLALASDQSTVWAMPANGGPRVLYSWSEGLAPPSVFSGANLTMGGGVAVLANGLVLAALDENSAGRGPALGLLRTSRGRLLEVNSIALPAPVAMIHVVSATTGLVVLADGTVAAVRLPSPAYQRVVISRMYWGASERGPHAVHRLHSAHHAGRNLMVLTWAGGPRQLEVVDLEGGGRRLVPLSVREIEITGGIALDHQSVTSVRLAIHGGSAVVVGTLEGDELTFVPTASVPIAPPPLLQNSAAQTAAPMSIAWSNTGEYIIAATSSDASEFVTIRASGCDAKLSIVHLTTVCEAPENHPSDILIGRPISEPVMTATGSGGCHEPTPTKTATVLAVSTPTGTPRPTATQRPVPVFLPIVLSEDACWRVQPLDIAIVLDTSSSMLDESPTKLSLASASIGTFVESLKAGEDQAALVTFDSDARLLVPLTTDHGVLREAVTSAATGQTTRLDLGIALAHEELVSSRSRPLARKVMIALTDGLPNPVGPGDVLREGALAADAGMTVFTIGLGDDVDHALLQALASLPRLYYRAPTADQLESIYLSLLADVPCEPAYYFGRR